MAGYGRPPGRRQRSRDEGRDTFAGHEVKITADAEPADAPELPDADEYLPQTTAWYATWAHAPQATLFQATDWQRLHMLAPIVDNFWREPSTKTMAEIRLNETLIGATKVDRIRGRITVEPAGGGSSGRPVRLVDRKRRLLDDGA